MRSKQVDLHWKPLNHLILFALYIQEEDFPTSWLIVKRVFFCSVMHQVCALLFPSHLNPSLPPCSFIIISFLSEADKEGLTHAHVQLAQHVTGLKAGIQDFPSCCVTDSHSCRWLSLRRPSSFLRLNVLTCNLSVSDCFLTFCWCLSLCNETVSVALKASLVIFGNDMEFSFTSYVFSDSSLFFVFLPLLLSHIMCWCLSHSQSTCSPCVALSIGQVTAFRELRTNRTPTPLTYVSGAIFHQKDTLTWNS